MATVALGVLAVREAEDRIIAVEVLLAQTGRREILALLESLASPESPVASHLILDVTGGSDMAETNPDPSPKKLDRQFLLNLTLAVCLAMGLLFPSIYYGVLLRPRSASDVLIASSVCLFSSLVYLWILHEISIITFRDAWVGKAIFGGAVAGVLATSLLIYKSQVSNAYPLVGKWDLTLERVVDKNTNCAWSGKILLINSNNTNTYTGLAEDATSISSSCPTGVRDITSIEWDDVNNIINISLANFPLGEIHTALNASPPSVTFSLKKDGSNWVSVRTDDKTNSAAFVLTLHRSS